MLDYLVEDVSLGTYLATMAIVVLGCGALYACLTPYSHGIANGARPTSSCTYLDGLYFSVVTLSSLGYGDLHPVGVSKAIACVEVLFGLAWLGIVVAKLTSRRLSYHVRRLFTSDAQRRLEEFIAKFQVADQSLRIAIPAAISAAFTNMPGNGQRREDQTRVLSAFRTEIGSLQTASAALGDYISYEAQHADYFALAPTDPIRRLEKTIGDVLLALGQVVVGLPPSVRTEFLEYDTWKRIADILRSQLSVCSAIARRSTDPELKKLAERVEEVCVNFPQNYFAIPVAIAEAAQPDQLPLGAKAPQEFVEPEQQQ